MRPTPPSSTPWPAPEQTARASLQFERAAPEPVWIPDQATHSNLRHYIDWLRTERGVPVGADYHSLWRWSVTSLADFWRSIWDYFDVRSSTPVQSVLVDAAMPGARWFPGTRLNYVEHMLLVGERRADLLAILDIGEGSGPRADRVERRWSWRQLLEQVGALAATLREKGVRPGDPVVGYAPNTAELVVGFLAAASIGAVWASCGQDYAAGAAAERLAQLHPVVLLAADGYRYNGREHDRRSAVAELAQRLPTLRATITYPRLGLPFPAAPDRLDWADATARPAKVAPEALEFDHPLWVLFSSGTTGPPKGLVHGHGGILLEHLKAMSFNLDLAEGDLFFWYTSPSWMVWNYLISGLLVGGSIVCYDGGPTYPDTSVLWDIAAKHRVTLLGSSPGHLQASARAAVPRAGRDLSALRSLGSSGSALPAEAYRWAARALGPNVQVNSTSGGTDVVSAFASSNTLTPVWPGELSGPCLGVALDAWDSAGQPVRDDVGELVVTSPMPSMPLRLWNDPDGQRYRDAYFSVYPGVWRHGDWITITSRGSVIVHGRSDSTLNRNGVRMGSSDIYRVVERDPQVDEALVLGIEQLDGGYWVPLFVVLRPEATLDADLRERLRNAIRTEVSPRHVPDEIIVAPAIPHTRTGKKLEVPIKRMLMGSAAGDVVDPGSVDDADALAWFATFSRESEGRQP